MPVTVDVLNEGNTIFSHANSPTYIMVYNNGRLSVFVHPQTVSPFFNLFSYLKLSNVD